VATRFGVLVALALALLTRVGRAVNRASVQSASYDEIGVNNSASATTQVVRR